LWFNKPFPKCRFFCEEQHLEQALEADFPFLSNEEDARLKTKLKAEYQKKFGDSIPDTVLSMARVYFDNGKRDEYTIRISVTRTATGGAIAKYRARAHNSPLLELELGIGDWLDFINALNKFIPEWQIDRQEKERRERKMRTSGGRHGTPGNCWEFRIYFWNREQYCLGDIEVLADSSCHNYYLYKWEGFEELINNMAERIKKDGKIVQR